MPAAGKNLFILGKDDYGLLHIRIFDPGGNQVVDTDESKLPAAQGGPISELKQELKELMPPHVLSDHRK